LKQIRTSDAEAMKAPAGYPAFADANCVSINCGVCFGAPSSGEVNCTGI
jgi:methionine aminopeptidase